MLHLLKIEWLKIKNYRTFWILSALFLISLFGINYIALYIQNHTVENVTDAKGKMVVTALIGNPFSFPDVWQTVSWTSGLILFIPALLMIISITNEYSYKTHRQNIIDGLSRAQFISVKMILAFIIALCSSIAVFLIAFFFGISQSSDGIDFGKVVYVGYFFLQVLSFTSLALVFSLLFKRSGITIGVFFLYVVVVEHMLSLILNHYVGPLGDFIPLAPSNSLVPFPFFRKVADQISKPVDPMYLLITSLIYLGAYYFICKKRFETSDL